MCEELKGRIEFTKKLVNQQYELMKFLLNDGETGKATVLADTIINNLHFLERWEKDYKQFCLN